MCNDTIAVAFCADMRMEVPLNVAAYSLLSHLAPGVSVHFYLLLTGFSEESRTHLLRTIESTRRTVEITFLSENGTEVFHRFPSLHGSHTTYFRLLLPLLVEESRLLYIDSDTLVQDDVFPLFSVDMGDFATGFVVDGTVRSSLERDFFLALGRDPESPMFNAGVMLLDTDAWKKQNRWPQVQDFLEKYAAKARSHDQTVLNALFAENCYHIDRRFNIKVYAVRGEAFPQHPGIYHYVGLPKPWDLGGRIFHPHAGPWYRALNETPLPLKKKWLFLSSAYWLRAHRTTGGYSRLLKSFLKR